MKQNKTIPKLIEETKKEIEDKKGEINLIHYQNIKQQVRDELKILRVKLETLQTCQKIFDELKEEYIQENIETAYITAKAKDAEWKLKLEKLKEEIWEDDFNGWHNKETLKHFSKIINRIFGEKSE